MPHLTVRRFSPVPANPEWQHTSTSDLRVHIARALLVNAAAMLRPRPIDFSVYAGEVQLLLSALHLGRNDPLAIRPAVRRASSHVQRFVTEGAALAVATELAGQYGWSLARGLPVHVDLAFHWKGPRPDLIFPVGQNQRIAGESRGRREDTAALSIRSAQSDRLSELDTWAKGPNGSQWFMAWCWFIQNETIVDFFDPGAPRLMERGVRRVEDAVTSELWQSAPSLNYRLLEREVRGTWLIGDLFGADQDGRNQAFLGVVAEPFPTERMGDYQLGQSEVELAISSRMITVYNQGGGMDLADIAGALRQID